MAISLSQSNVPCHLMPLKGLSCSPNHQHQYQPLVNAGRRGLEMPNSKPLQPAKNQLISAHQAMGILRHPNMVQLHQPRCFL